MWKILNLDDGLSSDEQATLAEQMEAMDQLDAQLEQVYSKMFLVCLDWVKDQRRAHVMSSELLSELTFEELEDIHCPIQSYHPFDENYTLADDTEADEFRKWSVGVVFRLLLEQYSEEKWQGVEENFYQITGEKIQRPMFKDAEAQTLLTQSEAETAEFLPPAAHPVQPQAPLTEASPPVPVQNREEPPTEPSPAGQWKWEDFVKAFDIPASFTCLPDAFERGAPCRDTAAAVGARDFRVGARCHFGRQLLQCPAITAVA